MQSCERIDYTKILILEVLFLQYNVHVALISVIIIVNTSDTITFAVIRIPLYVHFKHDVKDL